MRVAAEPASVLIAALEHSVGRPRQSRRAEHRAIVTPDSNQMSTMLNSFSNRCRRTSGRNPSGKNALTGSVHHVSAPRSCEDRRADRARDARIDDRRSARLAIDGRDRRAPRALARDAPLRMVLDHLAHARLAPRGDPADARNLRDHALAQAVAIHPDEPLRGRPEDHRVLAAPAMRIRMLVRLASRTARPTRAGRRRSSRSRRIRRARHTAPHRRERASRVDRIEDRQPVAHARVEVVGAVPGRGVHRTPAGVQLDVVGDDDDGIAQERMAKCSARATPSPAPMRCPRSAPPDARTRRRPARSRRRSAQSPSRRTRRARTRVGVEGDATSPGSVHGVVVQITTESRWRFDVARAEALSTSSFCACVAGKCT